MTDMSPAKRKRSRAIAATGVRLTAAALALCLASCASNQNPPPAEPSVAASEPPAASETQGAEAQVVAIPNAKTPLPGVVTGGAPTDADLQRAQALGYKTVISLLPDAEGSEEAKRARALGLRFVSIPVAGADDLTEDNARRLGEAMAAPDAKPLILHCSSGNRAGALLALEAFYVEGRSASEAVQLGVDAGLTKSRPEVEKRLQAAVAASQSE